MIKTRLLLLSFLGLIYSSISYTQNVPIQSYSVNNYNQVQLEIEASADKYYLLTALHEPDLTYESITSITMGVDGTMFISEPLNAYSIQNYKITAHDIADPDDTDGDGINDIAEFNNMPTLAPLNYADEVPFVDGTTSITSAEVFSELAVINSDIPWAPFLNNQEFAKFVIVGQASDNPQVYFVNSKTHYIHADFIATINTNGQPVTTGEIVYNPNEILPNGAFGSYSFNYSFGDSENFQYTYRTFELLAANMPFLQNNLQHFIGNVGEPGYLNNYKDSYIGSRLNVITESELFADVDFLPFNQAEGFGFFRQMTLDENPGSRDIVLYDALPNSLPRVGGIITSVIQTPLSHVNLRAIQDNVPNAYIKEPLAIDSIANLLGKYIYYKVDQDSYHIREASLDEVNDWYDKLRPTEDQIPDRDLSQTRILPLDEVEFDMSTSFGAKCSNVATMRKFGFPEGTIPNGFGVPFYFYDEFMKFNNFYDEVEDMISDPDFISDLETRIDMLKDFRKEIRAADMPQWMLDSLQVMHDYFPEGTSVRCRSSTNNEDLPGFSGAGLYTSKTQHPDEGHISKSIKQVYASMWNFRAFDERDFYRVDHFIAAMGVLCHPNYQEEKSNGVGVSIDPIYQTANTFYLNTQVGEALITNPEANEIPEELLLNEDPEEGYFVLRYSNLVPDDELVMGEEYLDLMRDYLKVIHDEFAILYNVVGAEGFGMDIEYKVTAQDQLIIKQARPWVSFWAEIKSNFDLAVVEITDPESSSSLGDSELITANVANKGLRDMQDFDLSLMLDDVVIETITITDKIEPFSNSNYQFTTPLDLSALGDYNIGTIVSHPNDGYDKNDTLRSIISKIHLLEGAITAEVENVKCGSEIDVLTTITNHGEQTFTNTMIEVEVNGAKVDTFIYDFSIPYLAQAVFTISVDQNLTQVENEIILNLISVNDQPDAISGNNSATVTSTLDSQYNYVTLIINADEYSEETSWAVYDDTNNELVTSGSLPSDIDLFTEDICVDYESCFTLYVYDTFGDGICCSYGMGNFQIQDASGNVLAYNNGSFGSEAAEEFCPQDGCLITATVATTNTSTLTSADGSINIMASNGVAPYEYSIDDGQNYSSTDFFDNLPYGEYMIAVKDANQECTYKATVFINADLLISVEDLEQGSLIAYPNPTDGLFTIEINNLPTNTKEIKLELFDSMGKNVYSESLNSSSGNTKTQISMVDYPAGMYYARCSSTSFKQTIKITKIK